MNGILKTEFLLLRAGNLDQARMMVDESVQIYNREPYLSLNTKRRMRCIGRSETK